MTWTLARRTGRMNPSAIREILKLTEQPGVLSLAGGLPSPETGSRRGSPPTASGSSPARC